MSYGKYDNTSSSPAREVFLITPHDTNALTVIPKALRVNTDGTLVFRAVDSSADVTMTVVAGELLPVRAQYVKTGTTAVVHGLA